MGQDPEPWDQQQLKSRRTPETTLDPSVIPWVPVARAFSTGASAGAVRKYCVKGAIEIGEGEPARVVHQSH